MKSLLYKRALIPIFGLLLTFLVSSELRAFNPQPEPPAFGMVGIVSSQTARLNVVNAHPPEPGSPVYQVKLGFADANGKLLLPAIQVTLKPGQSSFADFDLSRTDIRGDQRVQIRPVYSVHILSRDGQELSPRSNDVLATLEIFDTLSGQSQLILNPAILRGFNPQPEPPALAH